MILCCRSRYDQVLCTTMPVAIEGPSVEPFFNESSSPLDTAVVMQRWEDWRMGRPVTSELTQVGTIPLTFDLSALLQGVRMQRSSYGELTSAARLYTNPAVVELRGLLQHVVEADIARSDFDGRLAVISWAGMYSNSVHKEAWHSDNFRKPSVRWTVAYGIGSTLGAAGILTKGDTISSGDLGQDITVGPGCQLEPVTFPMSSVVRFMSTGDIHGGPHGNGPRIMGQATLAI